MNDCHRKPDRPLNLRDRVMLVLVRLSPRQDILGISVIALLASREDRVYQFLRIESALQLIRAHHPLRFAQIRKDVPQIVVLGLLGPRGSWNPRLKICELDEEFLTDPSTPIAAVASTLVHEATHARLYRLGFGYEEKNRPRIERICVKAQRAFAGRLPDDEGLAQEAEQMLEAIGGVYTFTDRELREREIVELKRSIPRILPDWLIRLADWWRKHRKG